jgi:ABC-type lipoprotein export system ATPase subunit
MVAEVTEDEEAGPASRGAAVRCENLVRIFQTSDLEVVALQGLDLDVAAGEMIAVIGRSGSGKSSLLNIVGGLDRPSAGRVEVAGTNLLELDDAGLAAYRRAQVGFVWQNTARNLVPYLSAQQNVEVPMLLGRRSNRMPRENRRQRASELLEMLGLADRRHGRLSELSGGEQQRVAVALALANQPELLLADEPTGSLNREGTEQLLESLQRVNRSLGVTIIIITHDERIASAVERVVSIRDGRASSEFLRRADAAPDRAAATHSHDEYAVVDKVGRLQLPRPYVDALGVRGRVKVELEHGQIVVRPIPGADSS